VARSRSGFARGPRRKVSWEVGPGGGAATAVNGVTSAFIGSLSNTQIEGTTLARLRGRLKATLTTSSAAGDGLIGAFGIGIALQPATAAGIASVPTPITEPEWDGWLFWTPIQLVQGDADFAAGSAFADYEVDTKSMRKLTDQSSIYSCVEIETEEGTATSEFWFDSRVLVMLP